MKLRKPSAKQKKAAQNIIDNHGNVSKAMIDAGYSPTSAKNPTNLTESKGFLAYWSEINSDDLLREKHNQLLNKTDQFGEVDVQAVKAGLDMAYKLKGSYAPEKGINLTLNADITNQEALDLAKKYEEELKKKL